MKRERLKQRVRQGWIVLSSKPARKVEAALIAYLITELTRRGWLPA